MPTAHRWALAAVNGVTRRLEAPRGARRADVRGLADGSGARGVPRRLEPRGAALGVIVALVPAVAIRAQAVEPRPADVSTLDGIIAAYYDVVSGPAGESADRERDRTLHHPDALVSISGVGADGSAFLSTMTLDEYHDASGGPRTQGFYEYEINREVQRFGNVAHVWSTYASSREPGAEPFARGINSIQLYHDGERWWITSWIFDSERAGSPIPPAYLPDPPGGTTTPLDGRGGLLGAAALSGQESAYVTTPELLERPHIDPDHVIRYGDGARHFGHLRTPEGSGPHPVLVVIHGGCWLSFADLRHLDELSEDFTEAGWATWSIEYRPVDEPGGGWPGTFMDVAAGVDHLRTFAGEHDLDLGRLAAIGHSAGGHLALWTAARARIPEGSELHRPDPVLPVAAISLGGVGDLEGFHADESRACGPDIITRLMGAAPEEAPDRYAAGSPARLLPIGAPQLLITGEDDGSVPPRFAAAYGERARSAGDPVEIVILEDAAHFEVVAPWSPRWPAVRTAVLRFLEARVR